MTAIHIQAADGTDFYRQVATFAYASSIRQGFGAVIVTEGEFRTYGDGRVEAKVVYVPYSLDVDLPSEVITLIWDYDPGLYVFLGEEKSEMALSGRITRPSCGILGTAADKKTTSSSMRSIGETPIAPIAKRL